MKRLLSAIPLLFALGAVAQIRQLPMGDKTNATPWWTAHGSTNSVVGWEAWQTVNTNMAIIGRKIGTNDDGRIVQSVATYDDVRIPISSTRLGVTAPTAKNFMGTIRAYAFNKNTEQSVEWELQVPHGIDTNYGAELHYHYSVTNSATTTNGVVWGCEYTAADPNRAFPAAQTVYRTNYPGTNLLHKLLSIVTISNITESAVIPGRTYRKAADAGDTHDDDAYLLSIDAHYVRKSTGSTNIYGDY